MAEFDRTAEVTVANAADGPVVLPAGRIWAFAPDRDDLPLIVGWVVPSGSSDELVRAVIETLELSPPAA